jgi:hypothetical protein
MTLDRYADLFDDDLDDVADRLDAPAGGIARTDRGLVRLSGVPTNRMQPRNHRSNGLSREWRRGESNP